MSTRQEQCPGKSAPRLNQIGKSDAGPVRFTEGASLPGGAYPSIPAFVGTATVSAVISPRAEREGPILLLADATYSAVASSIEIPADAAGVMLFSAGLIFLKEAVWVTLAPARAARTEKSPIEQRTQLLGYVVAAPIVHERFHVVGREFSFKVRAGQPGWSVAPGSIPDEATASYLNLFLF